MRFAWPAMLLLSAGLIARAAEQQSSTAATPAIRGFVMEPSTHQAVEGAEILLFTREADPALNGGGWKTDGKAKAVTDGDGAFSFPLDEPGNYRVEARKSGWAPYEYAEVTLTKEEPDSDVNLYLGQFGALSGAAVDGVTGQPVANLQLKPVAVIRSVVRPLGGAPLKTDSNGNFLAMGLSPGGYAIEVLPQTIGEKRLLTEFTDDDLSVIDFDFEHSFWPGGHGLEAALPVQVWSGETVSSGIVRAIKAPYYRVHVRIPVSDCEPGDTVSVSEFSATAFATPLGTAPCGKDILIKGYWPGSYRLVLGIDGRDRQNSVTASVPFTIVDRNISITAPLQPGVTVDGIVVAAEGARPPDFSGLTIGLRALNGRSSADPAGSTPDSEGRFRIAGVRPVGHAVTVGGMPETHYIKEMRYNGALLPNGTLPLDQAALSHALTLVVDDKIATLTGLVAVSGTPVSRPIAVAIRWPVDLDRYLPVKGQSDETGRFQINGLAPGEYRVIALRSRPRDPAAISNATVESLVAGGTKVEFGPGGIQNITIEPIDLR